MARQTANLLDFIWLGAEKAAELRKQGVGPAKVLAKEIVPVGKDILQTGAHAKPHVPVPHVEVPHPVAQPVHEIPHVQGQPFDVPNHVPTAQPIHEIPTKLSPAPDLMRSNWQAAKDFGKETMYTGGRALGGGVGGYYIDEFIHSPNAQAWTERNMPEWMSQAHQGTANTLDQGGFAGRHLFAGAGALGGAASRMPSSWTNKGMRTLAHDTPYEAGHALAGIPHPGYNWHPGGTSARVVENTGKVVNKGMHLLAYPAAYLGGVTYGHDWAMEDYAAHAGKEPDLTTQRGQVVAADQNNFLNYVMKILKNPNHEDYEYVKKFVTEGATQRLDVKQLAHMQEVLKAGPEHPEYKETEARVTKAVGQWQDAAKKQWEAEHPGKGDREDEAAVTNADATKKPGLFSSLPNWGKGLAYGGGALGAGLLAHRFLGGNKDEEEIDPETGQKRKKRNLMNWAGPLVGAGGLGLGAYMLKGDRPWKDLASSEFWKQSSVKRADDTPFITGWNKNFPSQNPVSEMPQPPKLLPPTPWKQTGPTVRPYNLMGPVRPPTPGISIGGSKGAPPGVVPGAGKGVPSGAAVGTGTMNNIVPPDDDDAGQPPPEEGGGLMGMWNKVPNWAKGLGVGAGALGAGYLADSMWGHGEDEEVDPETGQVRKKKKRRGWVGPLVGAGALGLGAYAMKGDRPWSDMATTDFWKKSSFSKTGRENPFSQMMATITPPPRQPPAPPKFEFDWRKPITWGKHAKIEPSFNFLKPSTWGNHATTTYSGFAHDKPIPTDAKGLPIDITGEGKGPGTAEGWPAFAKGVEPGEAEGAGVATAGEDAAPVQGGMLSKVPGWAKGLGVGAGALGAGYLADSMFGGGKGEEEIDPETGQIKKKTSRPWVGPLAGAGALGLGAMAMKGDRPWGDFAKPEFWTGNKAASARPALISVPRRPKYAGWFDSAGPGNDIKPPVVPKPPVPPPSPDPVMPMSDETVKPSPTPPTPVPYTPAPVKPAYDPKMYHPYFDPLYKSPTDAHSQGQMPSADNAPMPASHEYATGAMQSRLAQLREQQKAQAEYMTANPTWKPPTTPGTGATGATPWLTEGQEDQAKWFKDMPPEAKAQGYGMMRTHAPKATAQFSEAAQWKPEEVTEGTPEANRATSTLDKPVAVLPQGMEDSIANKLKTLDPNAETEYQQKMNLKHNLVKGGVPDDPSIWSQVVSIWDNMDTTSKLLVGGGLSFGALGILGMLTGNETIGGSTGMMLALGGLAAGAYGSGLFDSKSDARKLISGDYANVHKERQYEHDWNAAPGIPAPIRAINSIQLDNAKMTGPNMKKMMDMAQAGVDPNTGQQVGAQAAQDSLTHWFAGHTPDAQQTMMGMLAGDTQGQAMLQNMYTKQVPEYTKRWQAANAQAKKDYPLPPGQGGAPPGAVPPGGAQPGAPPGAAPPGAGPPLIASAADAAKDPEMSKYMTVDPKTGAMVLKDDAEDLLTKPARGNELRSMYMRMDKPMRDQMLAKINEEPTNWRTKIYMASPAGVQTKARLLGWMSDWNKELEAQQSSAVNPNTPAQTGAGQTNSGVNPTWVDQEVAAYTASPRHFDVKMRQFPNLNAPHQLAIMKKLDDYIQSPVDDSAGLNSLERTNRFEMEQRMDVLRNGVRDPRTGEVIPGMVDKQLDAAFSQTPELNQESRINIMEASDTKNLMKMQSRINSMLNKFNSPEGGLQLLAKPGMTQQDLTKAQNDARGFQAQLRQEITKRFVSKPLTGGNAKDFTEYMADTSVPDEERSNLLASMHPQQQVEYQKWLQENVTARYEADRALLNSPKGMAGLVAGNDDQTQAAARLLTYQLGGQKGPETSDYVPFRKWYEEAIRTIPPGADLNNPAIKSNLATFNAYLGKPFDDNNPKQIMAFAQSLNKHKVFNIVEDSLKNPSYFDPNSYSGMNRATLHGFQTNATGGYEKDTPQTFQARGTRGRLSVNAEPDELIHGQYIPELHDTATQEKWKPAEGRQPIPEGYRIGEGNRLYSNTEQGKQLENQYNWGQGKYQRTKFNWGEPAVQGEEEGFLKHIAGLGNEQLPRPEFPEPVNIDTKNMTNVLGKLDDKQIDDLFYWMEVGGSTDKNMTGYNGKPLSNQAAMLRRAGVPENNKQFENALEAEYKRRNLYRTPQNITLQKIPARNQPNPTPGQP